MAALSDHTPTYLSPRSADVVLSEIRPTKLAPEALRSVNVLLDELLWMILSTARSFSTGQLKVGMSRLLPTSLGKEALLEAEVELKAYWDRTTNTLSRPYTENAQDFPVQPAFELLRLKCEAYSTFNDIDEDTEAERRWQTKVAGSNGICSHNVQFIAPAALYLTAIIEHVCEHILSNTGRVASRDSSRSTATLQDLFIALCEDDAIYVLFKNMKVHNQIEIQSKAIINRPRRSKSFQRSVSDHGRGPSQASSSPFDSTSNVNIDAAQMAVKPRVSSESVSSGTATATVPSTGSRSSTEKSKAKKLFGRMSIDKEGGTQNGHNSIEFGHKRSASLISNSKRSVTVIDDGPGTSPSEVEFDELMRSGTTMKVSLTPDRLRTFDVYNKDKGRGGINKIVIPVSTTPPRLANKAPLQDSHVINSVGEAPEGYTMKGQLQQQRQVSAIEEDEDVGEMGNGEDFSGTRTRTQSKAVPPVSYEVPALTRPRSASVSQSSISSLGSRHAVGRKGSLSAFAVESPHSQSLRGINPPSHAPKMSESTSNALSSGRRTHPPVSRDSIDDIFNGSSDEDAPVKKTTGRRKAATGLSTQTADLIDFLNSGPPDLPKMMSPTVSISPVDNKLKRGRLRSIVSRLKGGSSIEKLSSMSSEDLTMPGKRSLNHPPPSFVPPLLSAKRSLHSISSYAQNQTLMPKPPPPPVPTVSIPLSPPVSPSPSQNLGDSAMSPARSKLSPISLRKAVPTFTDLETNRVDTNTVLLNTPKTEEVAPPTPSKMESDANKPQSQAKPSTDDTTVLSSKAAVVPPVRKSSISAQSPSPIHVLRPSSKQSQRHAFTPPATPSAFAAQAKDLRRLMSNATTADECRLLVDMFLAQSGFSMKSSDFPSDATLAPSVQHESAIVETLLSNGDVRSEKNIDEKTSTNGVGAGVGQESGDPPTPLSDDHYPVTTVYRKAISGVHSSPMTRAQATVFAEA